MGDTFAELVDTPSLVDHVAAAVGLTSVDIARNVSAKASKTSALLTVSARDGDPRVATSVATAVANELVNMAPTVSGSSSAAQQAIESDLSTVETQITATEQAIAGFGETPSAAQQVQVTLCSRNLRRSCRSGAVCSTCGSGIPRGSLPSSGRPASRGTRFRPSRSSPPPLRRFSV